MVTDPPSSPASFMGVMVSSTYSGLAKHRAILIKAINRQDLKAVAMEYDTAKPDIDVIDSSLQMVRRSAAYIGVIGHEYGQVLECSERNPGCLERR